MIQSVYCSPEGKLISPCPIDDLAGLIQSGKGTLWVNLVKPAADEIKQVMVDIFHFHPLAIEDCQSVGFQAAKVDDYDTYLFLIAHALPSDVDLEHIEPLELNIFLGANFIVTHHSQEALSCIDIPWKLFNRDYRFQTRGVDYVCHAILDHLVDDYLPLIDQMEEEIEWLEDKVLAKPDPQTLERLLMFKHSIMILRRVITPQREVVNRLSRDDFVQIQPHSRMYFRDIYDHLVRVQDMAENIRDIVGVSLDIYLNSTSLKLNEVMKALTIVSTIFLPLSFLAGVYGMNFKYFPEINWQFGYPLAWLVFILVVITMLLFFKKRGWF